MRTWTDEQKRKLGESQRARIVRNGGNGLAENLLHQTFNRLTAIGIGGRNKRGKRLWVWRCECGQIAIVRPDKVKNGHTKSCGCFMVESARVRMTRHGATKHGERPTSEYGTWRAMLDRCNSPTSAAYRYYGARGIAVCERWLKFEHFIADMGKRPDGLTLERKDTNGNYEPDNCKWATRHEQMRNTRRNVMITFNDETLCLSDWATRLRVGPTTLSYRITHWPLERALATA